LSVRPIRRGGNFLGEEATAVARKGEFEEKDKIEVVFSRRLVPTRETKCNLLFYVTIIREK